MNASDNIGFRHVAAVVGLALLLSMAAASKASALAPQSLRHAQTIRAELDVRYRAVRRGGLAVTEASSTGVVESFTLATPDLRGLRVVPAEDGIYYAVCPAGASCPYPARRLARPASDLGARRLALQLAVRTFLETSADVVAVSLPTQPFIAFVVERDELANEIDLGDVANVLESEPTHALSASLQAVVDRLTRPRIFVAVGLEPTASGGDTWLGMPRWPE